MKIREGLISLAVLAVVLSSSSSAFCAGDRDRAGNGGSFVEMKVITTAYEVLDALKALYAKGELGLDLDLSGMRDVLKVLRIEMKGDLKLREAAKSMVNYPTENLLQIDPADFEKNKGSHDELFQLVLHEMLPFMKVLDVGYVHSIPLMTLIRERGLLTKAGTGQTPSPVLVYTEGMEDPGTGLDLEYVQRMCKIQKDITENDYYFVYCTFIEKQTEKVVLQAFNDSYEVVIQDYYAGTETTHRKSHWKTLEVSETQTLGWGLRVFGWGKKSELPWKRVVSSLGLLDGSIDYTFETRDEADYACRRRLRESDQSSMLFYRARCRTPKLDDGRFFYEIVTQNPLINETSGSK